MSSVIRSWPLIAFVLLASLLVVMSSLHSMNLFVPELKALERAIGGDKNMHLVMSSLLAFLGCMSASRYVRSAYFSVVVVLPLLALALAADEVLQRFSAVRSFDWQDLKAGLLGIIFGGASYLIVCIISRLRKA